MSSKVSCRKLSGQAVDPGSSHGCVEGLGPLGHERRHDARQHIPCAPHSHGWASCLVDNGPLSIRDYVGLTLEQNHDPGFSRHPSYVLRSLPWAFHFQLDVEEPLELSCVGSDHGVLALDSRDHVPDEGICIQHQLDVSSAQLRDEANHA